MEQGHEQNVEIGGSGKLTVLFKRMQIRFWTDFGLDSELERGSGFARLVTLSGRGVCWVGIRRSVWFWFIYLIYSCCFQQLLLHVSIMDRSGHLGNQVC